VSLTTFDTHFFGTYDIRAIVGERFHTATYERLGQAYALWLKRQGVVPCVAVGHDVRLHGKPLYEALIQGLVQCGVSVVRLGMVPSPVAYFAEFSEDPALPELSGTLVVTASHNPAEYNGVKFTFQGASFTPEQLAEVKAVYADAFQSELASLPGDIYTWDAIGAYLAWTRSQFPGFEHRPKVVVDCGNGTAGLVIRAILEAANCDVIGLYEAPDGMFPNHHPDPCVHHNLVDLQASVLEHQADVGLAFDGDSDRLGVVDSQGRIVPGDMTLLLYAQALLAQGPAKVVSEVKCSQHLFEQIAALGGQPIMSRTGHAFLKTRMREENAPLGGELSGHFFFRDRHFGFDDAFYAALRLIELLPAKGGLARLVEQLPQSCLSEEIRIHLAKDRQPAVLAALTERAQQTATYAGLPVTSVNTTDGVRVNLAGGFWLVRRSNTEPCLTLRFEAPTPDALQTLITGVTESIDALISEL
jgi:phosphomannomutase